MQDQEPISIHAPHARSDKIVKGWQKADRISIHAPHARSDMEEAGIVLRRQRFQSTLLMRGATISKLYPDPANAFQSTLLMRGATSASKRRKGEESIFQSTLLMRGATVSILGIDLPDFIIYFSRTYPFSPKMPTSRHLSCKLHFLCDGTSHFGDL